MLAPAVMFIEMAQDSIKGVPTWLLEDQQLELSSFGDVRVKQFGASGLTSDFRSGYQLGIQTARMVLAASAVLAANKITSTNLL